MGRLTAFPVCLCSAAFRQRIVFFLVLVFFLPLARGWFASLSGSLDSGSMDSGSIPREGFSSGFFLS
jgi:hypothetical protein